MIKDILQQLAPLDEKIAALRGDPADENMTDITNHAAELAELSAQEDALLSGCGALTAEDRVFLARHPERPHIDEIVDALFTDFFEQCGDRQCKEDAAILGGVALFHGQPVTVIGHRKGSTLAENLRCNGIKPFACNIALHGAKGEKQSRRQQRRGRTVLFHSVRQGQNIAAEIRSPCGNEIFGNIGRDLLRAENINLVFANGNVARSVPVDSQSHKRTENIAVRELLGKFF